MLRSIALELTLLMVYHTCISDLHNMCFYAFKTNADRRTDEQTDGQTDGQMDICTSRAAFAAEKLNIAIHN